MKSNRPVAHLKGEAGSIFHIIAIVRRALQANGQRVESERMTAEVLQSHSYHEALNIMGRYVEFAEAGEAGGNDQ